MRLNKKSINKFIEIQNSNKKLLTPGPASLLSENIEGLEPSFGRGDQNYLKIETKVLEKLKKISGHKDIIRLQGAASLALEVMISNFLKGKILVIKTGTYSDRLFNMTNSAKKLFKRIKKVEYVNWEATKEIKKKYDWILCCYVETSIGLKLPIKEIYKLKKKTVSKLALDATASIGLEENHHYADVIGYSSCKGLFGLTGGCFVAFNKKPEVKVNQFNLDFDNHYNKKMTGPYHSICSLRFVLSDYKKFKYSVEINKKKFLKKMGKNLIFENKYQPLICTQINKKIFSKNKKIIFYKPRSNVKGSIVCHLGEVHLKKNAKGKILDELFLK